MTDKELKKLSRLELLELLLTESRENERLKEELEKAKQENSVEKSAQHLNETTGKLDVALQKMSSLITELGKAGKREYTAVTRTVTAQPVAPVEKETVKPVEAEKPKAESNDQYVDFNIYKKLIVFFISNPENLDMLPEDLRQTVINRIEEIKRK